MPRSARRTRAGERLGGRRLAVAELHVEPASGLVYEHGWQSWSPTRTYRLGEPSYRPSGDRSILAAYRPEASAPPGVYQGQGLLCVQPSADAPVHVFGVAAARDEVPSVRARLVRERLLIESSGAVEERVDEGSGGIDGALARWADGFARAAGVVAMRPAPTVWCSWYHYFTRVSEADIDENLAFVERLDLPVDVVQIDDGWQRGIGDWLPPTRFADVPALVARIRAAGRRAGLWLAPFLATSGSDLARAHADWLIEGRDGRPVPAGMNWEQELFGLDVTHPGVRDYLSQVFSTLRAWGVDYFKIDFVYAAALPGQRHDGSSPVTAYRSGLQLIREQIGDAYLLGCGAPLLPSVGLVDAMRISPDVDPHWEPVEGDISQPGARSAVVTGAARAWQQGRFWINDPDCLIVRPGVQRREEWAAHVERYGGLRASSDRLAELDEWGLETTRRLLSESPNGTFVPS